jgi:hypothetical protein
MGRRSRKPLAPSRVDACNPLLQAHPTWARDKHEGRGFPLLRLSPSGFFPPSRSVSRRPIWARARGDNLLVGPGTPRVQNADNLPPCFWLLFVVLWFFLFSSLASVYVPCKSVKDAALVIRGAPLSPRAFMLSSLGGTPCGR